ncbi:hypothetical protein ACIQGW_18770 [Lysinibacillus xylanilyticus]|uniref:hypothetical protein n=1 Tax=Lysinibacillus xylanilyticus TaxID=582475 RepID=UPI003818F94E
MRKQYLRKNIRNIKKEHNDLTIVERSSRIVLILTLFGMVGFFAKKTLAIFINIFSDKIYIYFPFRTEHILIVLVVSYLIIVFFRVLQYVYFELYSFSCYFGEGSNSSHQMKAINQANRYYYNIFVTCKLMAIYSTVVGLIVVAILGAYLQNYIIITLTLFLLLICIIFILTKRIKIIDIFKAKNYINKNLGILLSVSFFVFYLGVLFYVQPVKLNVKFESIKKQEFLIIESEYYAPNAIDIAFYHENSKGEYVLTDSLILNENAFIPTFLEVKQARVSSNESFMKILDNQINKFNEAYILKETESEYKYKLKYEDYLKEGNNKIVINIDIKDEIINNSYRVVNHIILKNGEYEVIEKTFTVGKK